MESTFFADAPIIEGVGTREDSGWEEIIETLMLRLNVPE